MSVVASSKSATRARTFSPSNSQSLAVDTKANASTSYLLYRYQLAIDLGQGALAFSLLDLQRTQYLAQPVFLSRPPATALI